MANLASIPTSAAALSEWMQLREAVRTLTQRGYTLIEACKAIKGAARNGHLSTAAFRALDAVNSPTSLSAHHLVRERLGRSVWRRVVAPDDETGEVAAEGPRGECLGNWHAGSFALKYYLPPQPSIPLPAMWVVETLSDVVVDRAGLATLADREAPQPKALSHDDLKLLCRRLYESGCGGWTTAYQSLRKDHVLVRKAVEAAWKDEGLPIVNHRPSKTSH